MKPIRDEDLILHYYGESSDPAELERRMESSPEIRERFEELRSTLDKVLEPEVPVRGSDYAERVWQSIEPALRMKPWWQRWLDPVAGRRWVVAGAAASLLAVAFLAGRISTQPPTPQAAEVVDLGQGRDRALFMTVANHLERSEMLLLELINVDAGDSVDVTSERLVASELRSQGRLYRQAAVQAGQLDVADLLERLEMVLIELANGPDDVESADLELFRQRLEEGDLLFRVRIVSSRLREDTMKSTQPEIDGDSALDV
jgi:hypothetical protein